MILPSKQNNYLEDFDEEFSFMLKQHGHDILSYIERKLYQYRLTGNCDRDEILNDVYLRTREKVEGGLVINNLVAWTKRVSFHCVTERSRSKGKTTTLDHDIPDIEINCEEDNTESFKILGKAFVQLSEKYRQVLYWKVIQGLSWRAVKEEIGGSVSVSTLRKRKERAIKELRKQFHEIERAQQKEEEQD